MAHGCAELVVTKSSSEYPRVAKKIEPTQNASCIENDNTCRRLVGTVASSTNSMDKRNRWC